MIWILGCACGNYSLQKVTVFWAPPVNSVSELLNNYDFPEWKSLETPFPFLKSYGLRLKFGDFHSLWICTESTWKNTFFAKGNFLKWGKLSNEQNNQTVYCRVYE